MGTSSAFAATVAPLSAHPPRPQPSLIALHPTLLSRLPSYPSFSGSTTASLHATSSSDFVPDFFDGGGGSTALVVLFALAVGLAAQSFINSMLDGDRGLGAFLSDGGGYGRSNFKPRSSSYGNNDATDAPLGGPDPLPWLKLPTLDYVEVAGQERDGRFELDPKQEAEIVARLEELADLMKAELKAGNIEEAGRIRTQLERTMEEYGFAYDEGFQ